jgi:hypothetical protein
MDADERDANRSGNVFCFAGSGQRLINAVPPSATPAAWFLLHPLAIRLVLASEALHA